MKMTGPVQLNETKRKFPFRVLFDDVPNRILDNHWHKEIELIYLLQYGLDVYINGSSYSLSEGDIVFIAPGDVHGAIRSMNNVRIVIQFDFSLVEDQFLSEESINKIRKDIDSIERVSPLWPDEVKDRMINIILAMRDEYNFLTRGDEISKLEIKSLLYQLISLSVRKIPKSKANAKISTTIKNKDILNNLTKVFKYLDEHSSEDITLEDAARVLNFSTNYFLRYWKKYMGITFHSYLNQYRINNGMMLLADKEIPIYEIAHRVGFRNAKTFNRVFKESTGITPSQYRKKF